jgi:hypothetical protein
MGVTGSGVPVAPTLRAPFRHEARAERSTRTGSSPFEADVDIGTGIGIGIGIGIGTCFRVGETSARTLHSLGVNIP